MISLLKVFAPLSLYWAGVICAILAFSGQIRWAVLLVIFLSPLRNVVDRLVYYPMGAQYLDILFMSMLFGWLVSSIFLRAKFAEKSDLNLISVVLILYTFISVGIGSQYLYGDFSFDSSDQRLRDAKNFCLLPVLFFLTLNGIKDRKWVWRTLLLMCAAMVLMGYYTSIQVLWYSSLESRVKIHGTFQFLGPNEVAAFYNVNSIIMLGVYFYMKKGWQKLLLLGLVVINLACMLFMYSRAAYAAVFVGLFLLFALKARRYLIPLVLMVVFWQAVLPEKAIERIEGTKDAFGEYDESTARRLDVWEESINIFQKNPLVGIGYGSFRHLGLNLGDTHNIYIKIAVEQGIIGLSIFFVLIMHFIREGYRLYKKGEDGESKGLGLGFMIAMVVVMINNFFGDRWSYYELAAYWWVCAGLVARLNALNSQSQTQPLASAPAQNTNIRLQKSPQLTRPKSPKKKSGSKFERSL